MPAVGAASGVAALDPHMVVDVEPRVWPGEHGVGGLRGEEAPPDESGENGPVNRLGEDGRAVEEERQELTVSPIGTVGNEEVEVRMPVQEGAEGLDGDDDAGDNVSFSERGTQELAQCVARDAAEKAREATIV